MQTFAPCGAVSHIPHPRRSVVAGAGNPAAIRVIGDRLDLLGVALQPEQPLSAGYIPQGQGAILATRDQCGAVRRKGHRINRPAVVVPHWVHDEPTYPAGNSYWLAAILTAARSAGVTTLLSGTAGNDTVSWRGAVPDLTGLLWRKGTGTAVDALRRMQSRTGLSPVALLWTGAAKPLLRRIRGRVVWLSPTRRNDWVTFNPLHPAFLPRPDIAPALRDEDPAMPTEQYHNGAQDRWLIRRAMADRLPDRVRLIRQRARQSADTVNRLHSHAPELRAVVARLEAQANSLRYGGDVLDIPRLAEVVGQIEGNPATVSHFTASIFLLRGLMVGLFLERF